MNSDFIDHLKVNTNADPIKRFRDSFLSTPLKGEELTSPEELETCLETIHFNPVMRTNCFNDKDQRDGFSHANSIWLPAERFFWEFPSLNLGSSRHILLKNLQLKGAGNNPMAIRYDNAHAWGGSYLWSNLKGLGFNILYKGILPKGLQELATICLWPQDYADNNIAPFELNSVVSREAKSYRVAQLMSGIDPDHPYKKDYQDVVHRLLPDDLDDYLDELYFQYGQMLGLGICDLNITKENIMIDGSLIDYEDISYLGNDSDQVFTLKLYYAEKIEKIDSLTGIINKSCIYLSDYHLYLDALKMSLKAYNKYFETSHTRDLEKDFFNFLISFREKVFHFSDDHYTLLKILSEHTALYRNGAPYFHLGEVIHDDLCKFLEKINLNQVKLSEADDGNTLINISLPFSRGHWINPHLESYYQTIKKLPVKDLVVPLLKLAEVYMDERKPLNCYQALEYSSKVNELLSRNSWFSPFAYSKKEFQIKTFECLEKIESEIEEKTGFCAQTVDSYHGILIGKNTEYKKITRDEVISILSNREVFIIQGITVNYQNFDSHYIPFNLFISPS